MTINAYWVKSCPCIVSQNENVVGGFINDLNEGHPRHFLFSMSVPQIHTGPRHFYFSLNQTHLNW